MLFRSEIRQYLGADSLGYLSLAGMLEAVGDAGDERHCTACYTGKYPTKIEIENGATQKREK